MTHSKSHWSLIGQNALGNRTKQMGSPKMLTWARKTIDNWTVCRCFILKTLKEKMAPLPSTRLNPSRPFKNIVIDNYGPNKIKQIGK
jgi:hypothetical protein